MHIESPEFRHQGAPSEPSNPLAWTAGNLIVIDAVAEQDTDTLFALFMGLIGLLLARMRRRRVMQ